MFHGPPESPGSAPTALSLCLRVGDLLNLHGSELQLKSPVGHPFSGSLLVLCPRETRRAASTSSLPLGWHKEGAPAPGPGRTPSDTRMQKISAHARQFLQPPLHCKLVSGLRPPSLCVHPGMVWGRPTSVPPLCVPVPPSLPLSWAVFPPLLLHPLPPTPWPSSHPMLGPSTPDHPQSCFLPWPGTGRSHCSFCPHHQGSPGTGPSSSGSQQGQQPPPPPRAHSYTGGRVGWEVARSAPAWPGSEQEGVLGREGGRAEAQGHPHAALTRGDHLSSIENGWSLG